MLDYKEHVEGDAEVERESSRLEEESQGWCSPEFSSGCILDTDFE